MSGDQFPAVDQQVNGKYLVEAWNNYPALLRQRDELREALKDIANAGESGPLSIADMHSIKSLARQALAHSEET
jgi:hypothetical protein